MLATAIVFVPLLAFAAMVLYVTLVFAASFFFTLLECTAQGQRVIEWPKEQFTERLSYPVRLAWMAGLWLLPSMILAAIIAKKTSHPSLGVAFALAIVGVLFPISALSAFIANSSWVPFHPLAPVRMLAKPVSLAQFYLIAHASTAAGIGGFYLAVYSDFIGLGTAALGSVIAALAWFVYACAIGRLLYVLTWEPPERRKPIKVAEGQDLYKPTSQQPKTRKAKKPKKLKPLRTPEGMVSGYGVAEDTPPPEEPAAENPLPFWERPKPHWDADSDHSPYIAHAPETTETIAREVQHAIAVPKESEMRLIAPAERPPPPDNSFGRDAFAPLVQNETMRNALILAFLLAFLSVVVRALFDLNPVRGE
jgi:hypothetical protein